MTDPEPTVRGQQLGDELRHLRETRRLSLAEAAERIDASASKLSRFETGRRSIPLEDISALLAVYGVRGAHRRAVLALAREAERRGWWQRNHPDFAQRQRTLISLEARASRIVNFENALVPGFLQTGEYTRAVMRDSGVVADDEVEERILARLRRHSVLLRQHAPTFPAIVNEAVLYQGEPNVLRRQLDHLVEASIRPNISIRVIPGDDGCVAPIGSFALLQQGEGPTVVYLENLVSSLFLEDAQEVETYRRALRRLSKRALDERQSVELIAGLARGLDPEESRRWESLPLTGARAAEADRPRTAWKSPERPTR